MSTPTATSMHGCVNPASAVPCSCLEVRYKLKHLRVILVEDCPFDVTLIEHELTRAGIAFTSLVVSDKTTFRNALASFTPDVILCDHNLPQFNSIEAFAMFQEYLEHTDEVIPFLLVTGEVSEEFAVQCIKAGVDDYILKDRLKRLPLSIESALKKRSLENERLRTIRRIILKEKLMKEAEQLAHLGSWQADLVTGEHMWSDENFRICGYQPGEVRPGFEAFFSVVHPEDVEALREGYTLALEHLDETQGEFRIVDNEGQLKYICGTLRINRDTKGTPVRLFGFILDITARKEAEIALLKSQEEYKSLFDQNPNAVFSVDLEGKLTKVNKGLTELTGFSAAELCNSSLLPLVSADDKAELSNRFAAAVAGQPQRFEMRITHKNERMITLDLTKMPIVVNNDIIGVYAVASDITEKKELQNLLHQAYRNARIGGWEINPKTLTVSLTDVTREIMELDSHSDVDLENMLQYYKPGPDQVVIREAVKNSLAYGIPWEAHVMITTARGNERWVRAMGEGVIKNGKCVQLLGTIQDIHERKVAEENLKQTLREKTDILESIGDGFFAVDKQWTVTYWNHKAELITGIPRAGILGKRVSDVPGDATSLEFFSRNHAAMTGSVSVQYEAYSARLKAWFDVNVYPSNSGLSIFFRDITDKKNDRLEIERQHDKLQDIARIQSHQIRGPLARMMGLINIIQGGFDQTHELPSLLASISRNARELDDSIRNIVRKTE